jgi:hypothetical protein
MDSKQMTKEELRTAVYAALRAWTEQNGKENSLLESLLLVQKKREQLTGSSPTAHRLAANQVLLDGINALRLQSKEAAQLLTARFLDKKKVQTVAFEMHLSTDQVKRRQRDAIAGLTQIIWEQETAVRTQDAHALKAKLMPATYNQLFGLQEKRDALVASLTQDQAHWMTAIVGIGGIGKTALADAAVRQVIEQFIYEQVAWLRFDKPDGSNTPEANWDHLLAQLTETILSESSAARSTEKYAQLRQFLKTVPSLIIIDNLESEADTAVIVEKLQDLANPSRFLMTTRVRLPETASVWTLFLEELSRQDSFQLIRHHAQSIGLQEFIHAADSLLQPIYDAIGGNPLALKLVVGLANVLPLPQILANLISVQHQAIESMYRDIFWQAWRSLSENGRILLEIMPMAADIGMSPDQMLAISSLAKQHLWTAITELANRSLLEVRGTALERRYGIHRLTETFLRTEIIHWPEDAAK